MDGYTWHGTKLRRSHFDFGLCSCWNTHTTGNDWLSIRMYSTPISHHSYVTLDKIRCCSKGKETWECGARRFKFWIPSDLYFTGFLAFSRRSLALFHVQRFHCGAGENRQPELHTKQGGWMQSLQCTWNGVTLEAVVVSEGGQLTTFHVSNAIFPTSLSSNPYLSVWEWNIRKEFRSLHFPHGFSYPCSLASDCVCVCPSAATFYLTFPSSSSFRFVVVVVVVLVVGLSRGFLLLSRDMDCRTCVSFTLSFSFFVFLVNPLAQHRFSGFFGLAHSPFVRLSCVSLVDFAPSFHCLSICIEIRIKFNYKFTTSYSVHSSPPCPFPQQEQLFWKKGSLWWPPKSTFHPQLVRC